LSICSCNIHLLKTFVKGMFKEAVNTLFDITCGVKQLPLHLIRNMKTQQSESKVSKCISLMFGAKIFCLKDWEVRNNHFVMFVVMEQQTLVFDGKSGNDQIHCWDGQSLSPK